MLLVKSRDDERYGANNSERISLRSFAALAEAAAAILNRPAGNA
jgi:hypothetical protein